MFRNLKFIGVGLGVGLPLVIALAGLVFYFLRRRQKLPPKGAELAAEYKDPPAFQETV